MYIFIGNLNLLCKIKLWKQLLIHLKDKEQLTVIKYNLNSINILFDKTNDEEGYYNSDFNKKMERAAEDKKAGRYKSIKTENLWK